MSEVLIALIFNGSILLACIFTLKWFFLPRAPKAPILDTLVIEMEKKPKNEIRAMVVPRAGNTLARRVKADLRISKLKDAGLVEITFSNRGQTVFLEWEGAQPEEVEVDVRSRQLEPSARHGDDGVSYQIDFNSLVDLQVPEGWQGEWVTVIKGAFDGTRSSFHSYQWFDAVAPQKGTWLFVVEPDGGHVTRGEKSIVFQAPRKPKLDDGVYLDFTTSFSRPE